MKSSQLYAKGFRVVGPVRIAKVGEWFWDGYNVRRCKVLDKVERRIVAPRPDEEWRPRPTDKHYAGPCRIWDATTDRWLYGVITRGVTFIPYEGQPMAGVSLGRVEVPS